MLPENKKRGRGRDKDVSQPVGKKKLSRRDRKQIEAAIARANRTDRKEQSAQDSIPYQRMWADGICRVTDSHYTKTVQFQDINYQLSQNEDKVSGTITEATFLMLIEKSEQERIQKSDRLDALLSEAGKVQQELSDLQKWTALIRKYLNLTELDRNTVDELIDRIEVSEATVVDGKRHQNIKIFYRFVGAV